MWSFRRSLALFVAAPCIVLCWAPGCTQQSEGERCDFIRSGDSDCEPPLRCVPAEQLINSDADRCCPPADQTPTDERCLPSGSAGTGGKDGGTGGSDSGSGGTDSSSGGTGGSDSGSGGAAGGGGTGGTGGAAGSSGGGGTSGDAATDADAD